MGFSFYFSIFCAFHLLGMAFLLVLLPHKRTSNGLFALFLVVFSTIHLQHIALQTGFLRVWPFIDPICGIVLSALGPLLLFYVRSMTTGFEWRDRKNLVHAWVLVAPVLHLFFLWFTKEPTELWDYYYGENEKFTIINALLLGGMIVYFGYYIFISMKELRVYQRYLEDNYSNLDRLRVDWLFYFIGLLALLAVGVAPLLTLIGLPEWNRVGMGCYSSLVYFMIMYKTMQYSQAGVLMTAQTPAVIEIQSEETKNSEELVPERVAQEYVHALTHCMTLDKPYLQQKLTLPELATLLNIPHHHLSYVLNQIIGRNFHDYINMHRISHVKELFDSSAMQTMSIEGIGYESGFGSKGAFYQAFKKEMGMSPGKYLEQLQAKLVH